MLQLSDAILGKPVLSLRTGGAIAMTDSLIVNPNNLKIEGLYCNTDLSKSKLVLLAQDIRDILPQGLVVNDLDALTEPEDLIRLKETMEIGFEVLGKPVVTVSKKRLGRVRDFAADSSTLYIQKLYVSQSLFKSLSTGQLSIDRNQIVEITSKKIIIKEILKPVKSTVATTAQAA